MNDNLCIYINDWLHTMTFGMQFSEIEHFGIVLNLDWHIANSLSDHLPIYPIFSSKLCNGQSYFAFL